MQTFLFMKDWLIFSTGPLNVLLGKIYFLEQKNEKLKGREFLQLFVETLPNKLSSLSKKDNKLLPYIKNYLIEVLVCLSFKS